MFGQIEEMQKQLQEKLEQITIQHKVADGKISIDVNANRKVLDIVIDPSLLNAEDPDELQDLLIIGLNEALQQAEAKASEETQNMMSGMLPPGFNFPGM